MVKVRLRPTGAPRRVRDALSLSKGAASRLMAWFLGQILPVFSSSRLALAGRGFSQDGSRITPDSHHGLLVFSRSSSSTSTAPSCCLGRAGYRALTRTFEELFGVARGFDDIPVSGMTDEIILTAALERSGVAVDLETRVRFTPATASCSPTRSASRGPGRG